jgi:hypothetical protein
MIPKPPTNGNIEAEMAEIEAEIAAEVDEALAELKPVGPDDPDNIPF